VAKNGVVGGGAILGGVGQSHLDIPAHSVLFDLLCLRMIGSNVEHYANGYQIHCPDQVILAGVIPGCGVLLDGCGHREILPGFMGMPGHVTVTPKLPSHYITFGPVCVRLAILCCRPAFPHHCCIPIC